jgi:hypothetical protein
MTTAMAVRPEARRDPIARVLAVPRTGLAALSAAPRAVPEHPPDSPLAPAHGALALLAVLARGCVAHVSSPFGSVVGVWRR